MTVCLGIFWHIIFDGYFGQVEDDASASPRLSLKGARIVRSHVEYEIELSFLGETYRYEFKLTDLRIQTYGFKLATRQVRKS